MKMVKSLLLGSAAGLVAVAGAQAADLPVKAKPVRYVKICTLYGDGFYYIPGTDTCIRFSGYIRSDYGWNVTGARTPQYTGAPGAHDRTSHEYTTRHRANFHVDTRTQTAYGTIRTYWANHFDVQDEGSVTTVPQRAFIQWAGFTFGRTNSFTDGVGQIGDCSGCAHALHQTQNQSDSGANGTNQIAYTWQLGNGITLNVGADERRVGSVVNRSITAVTVGAEPSSSRHGDLHPNPWVALRINQAWGQASVAVIGNENNATYYNNNATGTCAQTGTTLCGYPSDKWGWAVISGIEFKTPFIAPGDRIGGYFNYGVGAIRYSGGSNLRSPGLFGSGNNVAVGMTSDALYINGSSLQLTTAWTAGGFFEHFWTRNFSTTWYGNYTEVSYNSTVVNGGWWCSGPGLATSNVNPTGGQACDPSFHYFSIGSHTDWYPVPKLRLAVEVLYVGIDTAMAGPISLGKAQGARPTGAYTAKDLGITSVIFRAQRNWP